MQVAVSEPYRITRYLRGRASVFASVMLMAASLLGCQDTSPVEPVVEARLELADLTSIAAPPDSSRGKSSRRLGTPTLKSSLVSLSASSVDVGKMVSATARFLDTEGRAFTCGAVTWESAPSGSVSFEAQSNPLAINIKGSVPGSSRVRASCDAVGSGEAPLEVVATNGTDGGTTTPPPTQPAAGALELRILRIQTVTTTSVPVSAGLPLKKGLLRATQLSGVKLFVNNVEVARHVSALQGTHSDGSLRSILVQFAVPQASLDAPVRLEMTGRTLPELARVVPQSVPTTIVTYADQNKLVETGIVGLTVSRAAAPTNAPHFVQFETDFDKWQAVQWDRNDGIVLQNYYDRVLSYLAAYVRTGNPTYLFRGATTSKRYRDEYIIPENYGLPEWQGNLDGMAVHYWLTGDEPTRSALILVAGQFDHTRGGDQLANYTNHPWMDNRNQARVLGTKVLALMLGATSIPGYSWAQPIPDLKSAAALDLTRILSTQQRDGAYRWTAICGESSNFMTALLNGVLGQYYDEVVADPRILDSVKRSYSWLYTTQWLPASRAFNYYSGPCTTGGPGAAGDLNGLYLDGLAWLYRQTRDPSLRTLGEEVFRGGVESAYLYGPKQFNQQYEMSYRWLGVR